ncbi:MAG: aldolase [Eubacteriales bacterium]|jgi:class I fructose-bisphosphate aldolase|nr:aldolase [Eubacteriales bacterium]MDD3572040.1 aldolase [Eubacteriales bacterium]MDD4134557.1 aldolase [Eubacteriales bacterium]
MMKSRMRHFFGPDGRAFVLAMDHAALMPSPALKDPGHVAREAAAGGVDAFLATFGIVKAFSKDFGRAGIILRGDGGASALKKPMGCLEALYRAEDALRLGADAMLVMGYPGSENNEHTLGYLARLAADCDRWGLPLGAEMLPYGFEKPLGITPWSVENVAFAARQGVELGADFIKTAFVGGERFREVADHCPAPVLVLGGSDNQGLEALLHGVKEALGFGARGVIMGRNIYRHENIARVCAAVAAVVHGDADVKEALKLAGGVQ